MLEFLLFSFKTFLANVKHFQMGIHVVQAPLDLLAVLIKTRIVVLIIMTDVKVEAKAVEGAKQVSWFDPTLNYLSKQFVRLSKSHAKIVWGPQNLPKDRRS